MKRSAFVLSAAVCLCALGLSTSAQAMDVRSDGRVAVGPTETIHDDLYVFGGQSEIQGTIDGDLVVMGGQIRVTGEVTRDVFLMGGNLTLDGPVGGTVRALGGSLTVSSHVGHDLMFAGGSLAATASSAVGGDVGVGAGEARIDGTVGRDVVASAGDLRIGGHVMRNVRGEMNTISLGPGAVVQGDVRYVSRKGIELAPGASVMGQVERTAPTVERGGAPRAVSTLFSRVRRFVGALALGLLFVLMFPVFSNRGLGTLRERPWVDLGIGVAFFVAVPVVGVLIGIVGMLIAGWWVGALIFGLYLLALGLGYVLASVGLGRWILARLGQAKAHPAFSLTIGLLVLILLGTVPILGPAVALVAILFGTGALARSVAVAWKRHGTQELEAPKPA